MASTFTHNATMGAYLVLASVAGGVILEPPVWGVLGVSAVIWPLAFALKRRLARDPNATGEDSQAP